MKKSVILVCSPHKWSIDGKTCAIPPIVPGLIAAEYWQGIVVFSDNARPTAATLLSQRT
jgi:hypothetical protein